MATAASRIGQYALPISGAPRDPSPRTAPNGQMPSAIIMHHTSGHGTPQGIVRDWQSSRPGIGSQYIVTRDGTVVDTASLGHRGTNHTRTGMTADTRHLGNRNTVGFEVIAKNDRDVTPEQIRAIREFIDKNYPDAPLYGHGQLDTANKEADEGMAAINAIREGRAADQKMAGVSELAGGAEGGSNRALAQYDLPGRETLTAMADASAAARPSQYALPQAEDPMTAGSAASRSSILLPESFRTPEVQAAMQNVANRQGIASPEAIAGLASTESNFNTRDVTPSGTYRGLTQMGEATFREAGGTLGGLTWQQYQNAKPEQQIAAYGDWLRHYGFNDKTQAFGVDFSKMTPAQQNAYLQGFQFGPNAVGWQSQYGQGKDTVKTTGSDQADFLEARGPTGKGVPGTATMARMTEYYDRLHAGQPKAEAVAAQMRGDKLDTTQIAKAAPKVDIAKGFEQAAAGASGGSGGGIGSDAARAPEKQWSLPKSPAKATEALADAAKAFAPESGNKEGTKTPLGALGEGLGALGDARMTARMAAIKAMPLIGEPQTGMPPPATPEPPVAAPTPQVDKGAPLAPPPDWVPPTLAKAPELPPPGPEVPQITPPPVNNAANLKLAEAFEGGAPSWMLPDTTPPNIFGDTANATGGGAGSILPPQPQPQQLPTALAAAAVNPFESAAANPLFAGLGDSGLGTSDGGPLGFASASASVPWLPETTPGNLYGETPNASGENLRNELAKLASAAPPDIEMSPAVPAQGGSGVPNPTTYGGGPVGPGQVADSNWGIIVPPVHTPLDFSAIQASINAPVNPLAGVNMSSPAFWFGGAG